MELSAEACPHNLNKTKTVKWYKFTATNSPSKNLFRDLNIFFQKESGKFENKHKSELPYHFRPILKPFKTDTFHDHTENQP